MAQRYKVTCRCRSCGYKWSRIVTNYNQPDPPCPRPTKFDEAGEVIETCGADQRPRGIDLTLNKAPASIGGNLAVKAIDETANIVMRDYGMTDMRDDVRVGESAAPKLHPTQQKMADGFFSGGASKRRMGFNPGAHAAAALRGSLRDPVSEHRSIGAMHAERRGRDYQQINRPGSER